eukprot:scaffold48212_cov36-Phaeocystis_antarctica.AAC.2
MRAVVRVVDVVPIVRARRVGHARRVATHLAPSIAKVSFAMVVSEQHACHSLLATCKLLPATCELLLTTILTDNPHREEGGAGDAAALGVELHLFGVGVGARGRVRVIAGVGVGVRWRVIAGVRVRLLAWHCTSG